MYCPKCGSKMEFVRHLEWGAFLEYHDDEYQCPRCGHKLVVEFDTIEQTMSIGIKLEKVAE